MEEKVSFQSDGLKIAGLIDTPRTASITRGPGIGRETARIYRFAWLRR